MKWNKIKIVETMDSFSLTIDGVKIEGVKSLEYNTSVDEIPILKLELFTGDIEFEINGE
jgi:hypothetical protein